MSEHPPSPHFPFYTHLRHLSSANNPPQQRGGSGPGAFAADCIPWGTEVAPGSSAVVLLSTPEPVCPYPLTASDFHTWPWQCGSGWAVSTHPILSHFSQLPHRQEAMVCKACSDPVHTFIPKRHGSLFQLLAQMDHLQVAGRNPTFKSIFGRISFSTYPLSQS